MTVETTISMLKWPVANHIRAKQAAAARRMSINDWLNEAIREKLARQNGGKKGRR